MYIIHTDETGRVHEFWIGKTSYSSGSLTTILHEKVPAGPDGTVNMPQATYAVPLSILSPDIENDVGEWFVSPEGPFSGGRLVSDAAFTLESARSALKSRIKQRRNKADFGGVTNTHGSFDTDPDSQRKISGAVTMALILDTAFTIEWRRSDNTTATLDKQGMIDVGISVGFNSAAAQANKNALDALADAAITVADLDVIDIENGWPT